MDLPPELLDARARLQEAFGQLPLSFEAYRGHPDESSDFVARGPGYTLMLEPGAAELALHGGAGAGGDGNATHARLRMELVGANRAATVFADDQLPGTVNYFLGASPDDWRTNIPTYGRVHYQDVYPGIDVIYYGKQRELEFDFVVAPGADPSIIGLSYVGARDLRVDDAGALVLETPAGIVRQPRPVIYQETHGGRQPVEGTYALREGQQVGLSVGAYDPSRRLVIDPTLAYSTYLGGSSFDNVHSIAVDSAGNAYLAGHTCSQNFPVVGPYQALYRGGPTSFCSSNEVGGGDAFVAKLNAAGSALLYSTYLGGTGNDYGSRIAVDGSGNAYVTGNTQSTDFPTTSSALGACAPGLYTEFFVAKLNATGSSLVYSVCGAGGDAIAVDSAGSVYTGYIDVIKLSPSGTTIVYQYPLYPAYVRGIAVDPAGYVYAAGYTSSTGFSTTPGAFQPSIAGDTCIIGGTPVMIPCQDGVVVKLSPTFTVVYATYLGGTGDDLAKGIAVDGLGNAYVVGDTCSTNFPVLNAVQPSYGGAASCPNIQSWYGDAFVAKLNATGSALLYSTYLGGSGNDLGTAIAVDKAGQAYVTGWTVSANFPLQNPLQNPKHDVTGAPDGFLAKLSSLGSALACSTYLGGGGGLGFANSIAVDGAGNVLVAGATWSNSFPTTAGAFQTSCGGGCNETTDGFIAKIADPPITPADLTLGQSAGSTALTVGSVTTYTLTVTNAGPSTATGVGLTVVVPAPLSAVTAVTSQGVCRGTGTITCSLGAFPLSASATVTLTLRPTAPGVGTITAVVGADQPDRIAANNTVSQTFTVSAAAPPDNDNYAAVTPGSPFAVTALPAMVIQLTTGASTEAAEPSPGCGSSGATVWYTFTPASTTAVTVSTFGSDFDTLIAVYTGSSLGALTAVACNDDASGTLQSRVTFTATGGTKYSIQIGGYQGAVGGLALTLAAAGGSLPAAGTIQSPLAPGPGQRSSAVAGEYSISVAGGAPFTTTVNVTLALSAKPGTVQMQLSNDPSFSGAVMEPFAASRSWTLTAGGGTKIVYGRFFDSAGAPSPTIVGDIVLSQAAPTGAARVAARPAQNVVGLNLSAAADLAGVQDMRLSGRSDFVGASFQPYFTSASFDPGNGDTAYIQFRDRTGTTAITSTKLPALGVNPTSTYSGDLLTVTWGFIPIPSTENWVGLYAVSADDRTPLAEQFTPGGASGSAPFVVPAGLAAGAYELRLFAQKGITRLATSQQFTVAAPPPRTLTPTPTTTPSPSVTPTRTATPTPTRTATPGIAATPTTTPLPTATPIPRTNVNLQTVPDPSTQTLQVTVTARDAGCTPNNQLASVQFGQERASSNELVDLPDLPGMTVQPALSGAADRAGRQGAFSVTLPPGVPHFTFVVRRATPGLATTVNLLVVDGCGSWQTLVGGGPAAGF